MRLSSRLSDENQQCGEIESIFDLRKYVFFQDQDDEDDRIVINEGDFVEIEIGQIFLPFYSTLCDDIVSFVSEYKLPSGLRSKLHGLVMSNQMISIDCQLRCGKYNSNDLRCQDCLPYVQAWFLVEADDIFSNQPTVKVVKKNFKMPAHIKSPVETADKYTVWLAKADMAYNERFGAGSAIYLRAIFESLVRKIGEENGIESTFINKWSKEQHKTFEQYLVSVDEVCKIIPEQYSQNSYALFRKLSNIAHGGTDEETALREYNALRCLVVSVVENVKRKQDEIRNNQAIQKALREIGFIKEGEDNE